MGRPKALLPFGGELMVQRVVRLLGEVVAPVVVVAARGQHLPELPAATILARDRRPQRGPLEGIAVGLRALAGEVEAAFVAACDLPLLKPEFIRRVIALVGDCQAAVPHREGHDEPLSAVYRTGVLDVVETLLAEDHLRPAFLFQRVPTRRIEAAEFAAIDPELESVRNLNTPEDYRAALELAGLPWPNG